MFYIYNFKEKTLLLPTLYSKEDSNIKKTFCEISIKIFLLFVTFIVLYFFIFKKVNFLMLKLFLWNFFENIWLLFCIYLILMIFMSILDKFFNQMCIKFLNLNQFIESTY